MPIYEFIPFIMIVSVFLFGFLYCLLTETKSNYDFRKRLIDHMDRLEKIVTIKDER